MSLHLKYLGVPTQCFQISSLKMNHSNAANLEFRTTTNSHHSLAETLDPGFAPPLPSLALPPRAFLTCPAGAQRQQRQQQRQQGGGDRRGHPSQSSAPRTHLEGAACVIPRGDDPSSPSVHSQLRSNSSPGRSSPLRAPPLRCAAQRRCSPADKQCARVWRQMRGGEDAVTRTCDSGGGSFFFCFFSQPKCGATPPSAQSPRTGAPLRRDNECGWTALLPHLALSALGLKLQVSASGRSCFHTGLEG